MSSRLEDLEPVTLDLCNKFLTACAQAAIGVRVTHTLRTMEEQAHLYAKGRTVPGQVVTKARPGQSPHNFGMAFDICFKPGDPYPNETSPLWEQVGAIGEGVGLAWGGRWRNFRDRPHFERPDWRVVSGRLA